MYDFGRIFDPIVAFLPNLISAVILLLVAWLIATLVRRALVMVLIRAGINQRTGSPNLARTIADIVYWLIFLLFLPGILGALNLTGLFVPVQEMVSRVLGFLPNIFAAVLIGVIGWFVARLAREIVTNLLAAVGADRIGARVGMPQLRISNLLGLVVFTLIIIPVITAALNALALEAVTRPVSTMLNNILAAIPYIFAAILVLAISFVVARIVASLVTGLLSSAGFDALPARLGLSRSQTNTMGRTPSQLAGYFVLVAIMLFASIEAATILGFGTLAVLLSQFLLLAGQVIFGLIIFAVGLFIANLIADAIQGSGARQADLLAMAARASIMILAGAIALRQMGIANEIITLAFGLLLGAIAVAVALAFGLGARETAGRIAEEWRQSLRNRTPERNAPGSTGSSSPGMMGTSGMTPPMQGGTSFETGTRGTTDFSGGTRPPTES